MSVALQTEKTVVFGKPLYYEMKAEFDYSQITWTMLRYNEEMTEEEAERLLDAFLQWISLTPLYTGDRFITMFQTPVEEAFHCFVLNTRLYKEFCGRFLGFFFHHDPLVDEEGPEVEASARYTIELLEQSFGIDLSPELQEWRRQFDAGTYKVACSGPGGHC